MRNLLTIPAILFGLVTLWAHLLNPTEAWPQLFWCPDKPVDQQFSAAPDPGCLPFEGEPQPNQPENQAGTEIQQPRITGGNLQREISAFLDRHNQFIACCATDPKSLNRVQVLEGQATNLLKAIQSNLSGSQIKIRGFTFRELLRPVMQARSDLYKLKQRLGQLGQAQDQMPLLDYEASGREKRKIQDAEEAIQRDFRPVRLGESGRTGANIQDTSLPAQIGSDIGSPISNTSSPSNDPQNSLGARTGADIGNNPSTGNDIGQTPSTGFGIGSDQGPTGTSSLPTRAGSAIGK